ncbi:MAG: outer membrane protein assembly factor BamD [Deltaproteobacteria bacterium]|nr:outer membrane protein assembly factor BamD [Deltaproteobacteria bacterium]
MKRCLTLGLICLLMNTGCAWFDKWLGKDVEKTAYELAIEGMDDFERGKFSNSIKLFEKLKDWYPFSKYAILAELKIADAHYELQEYAEAVMAYEEFENLHPRNEAIPYAIYQIGICYFEQVDTIDRDQTATKEALSTFRRLVKQFPNDPYANLARAKIRTCLKSLAANEFHIGLYYFKTEHYKGALSRFKSVITNYPDAGVHYQALQYIARCEKLLQKADPKKK